MAVRYVVGRAGKGKTNYIFGGIRQKLEQGDQPLLLLVPEQYTLQAERDLIENLGHEGIMRLEVLSLSRIARRVIDTTGGRTRILINEQGKHMVLRKVIDASRADLILFKDVAAQPGFVEKCSEIIAELKQQDITPDRLEQQARLIDDRLILKDKLYDISLIYQRFNDYLQGKYIDTEDYINLVIEQISKAESLHGAQIWIDNFTTFSSQSIKVIEQLMLLAEDITISLSMDFKGEGRDNELFMLSRHSYKQLHNIARQHSLSEKFIYMPQNREYPKSPELMHVESELYAFPYRLYQGEVENLSIFAAMNIGSEVENLAARIISLVRDSGYRFRDIAVICNDMETYGNMIKQTFAGYGIPCFIDSKRSIVDNPLVELLMAALDIVQKGYRYQDVFRLLKTGLCNVEDAVVEELENYVLGYGIQGSKWKEDFQFGEPELREEMNNYRKLVMEALLEFEQSLKKAENNADASRALFEFLEDVGVPEKLSEWIDGFTKKHLYELASEYTQIWNVLLDILDQMVEILGEQSFHTASYKQILAAGLGSCELGLIPTTTDQVLVGNIQRSKSHDIKALFIVGVNDGILPSNKEPEGVLSPMEKELLQEEGLEIGLNRELKAGEENFLIYSALAKAGQYLRLSYAMADIEGKALRPSLLIQRFKQLFPGLRADTDMIDNNKMQLDRVSTPESTYKYLAENLRAYCDGKNIGLWWEVYNWYRQQSQWREKLDYTRRALFHQNQPGSIEAQTARNLYGVPLRASISRLEQYAACPFAHFIRYGLQPRERKSYEIKAPDIGELFHNAFLYFARKLESQNLQWQELDKKRCHEIMDEVMEGLLPGYGDGVFYSTHRYLYLAGRMKKVAQRAVWTLCEHIKKGDFAPRYYEIGFGEGAALPPVKVELSDGETVFLEGRIDRIDLLEDQGIGYFRIIDYKSGDRDFNFSDIYYGLSLQLLVYLMAVYSGSRQLGYKEVKPAALLYFKIDDPLVESDSDIIAEIEKKIAGQLKMKGLVLKDSRIVRSMERDIKGYSDIMPVGIKADEGFYEFSSVADENGFHTLIGHAQKMARKFSEEILSGKIGIEPVKKGTQKPCDYCIYKPVCQFDQLFVDNSYRNLIILDKNEARQRILKEKEGGGGHEVD